MNSSRAIRSISHIKRSPHEDIINNLTVPLKEHYTALKLYNESEKKKKIREIIERIEYEKGHPPFFDMFMRSHNYLRISLTEKCNFRCLYCMPEEGIPLKPNNQILSNHEIDRLVQLFAAHGVDKVRLTGGEPTIRKDIVKIVESIANTKGIKQVGMTTNGLILRRFLPDLVKAGLTKINISIDSLDPQKFAEMTRRHAFEKVWKSIEESMKLFPKVKLNVVIMRNENDNEINDFIELTKNNNLDVRFIEFMPFGGNHFENSRFIGYRSMLSSIVEKYGKHVQRLQDSPNDTTKAYKISDYRGQFGFITSMSDHFCNTCNRLRITADGNLKVCLHGNAEVSLRDRMRDGASNEELSQIIQKAVNNKKARHAEFRYERTKEPSKSSYDSYRGIATTSNPILFSYNSSNHSKYSTSIRLFNTTLFSYSNCLTHVDCHGSARKVDVSQKSITIRSAVARGTIYLTPEISKQVANNSLKKGDVLTVAKISSIMGAKQVANLIPLCHSICLDFVDSEFVHNEQKYSITVTSTAKCCGKTGVEMEALMACSIALLTIYDMCKAISQKMVISEIKLVHKSGGKTTYNIDNVNKI